MEFQDNQSRSRLELNVDGHIAFIDYKIKEDIIYLIHTEVPPSLGGRGIGKALVTQALTYIEEQQWRLRPVCPFVNYFLRNNPDWMRVVDSGYRPKSLEAIEIVIPERERNIGMFDVGRVLPFRKKRMVGPFIYLDRMGPAQFPAGEGMDVPPHPHIGLSTLTYLFDGVITHRDSTGAIQDIVPGEVNVMTAGNGVSHSERSPEELRSGEQSVFGMQFWIALPTSAENKEPFFEHYESDELPVWEEYGVAYRLIAGEIGDRKSPVQAHSSLFMAYGENKEQGQVIFNDAYVGERAFYIVEGEADIYGEKYRAGNLVVLNPNKQIAVQLAPNSKVMIFGGEPFPEERHIWWNFVHSSQDMIEKAKQRWLDQDFGQVPGETDLVPLPSK